VERKYFEAWLQLDRADIELLLMRRKKQKVDVFHGMKSFFKKEQEDKMYA
jgi:hypothetical protein